VNVLQHRRPERIERFIEGQTSLRSYDSAPFPPPPPLSVSKLDRRYTEDYKRRDKLLTGGGGGARGWAWTRIIPLQKNLVAYIIKNSKLSRPPRKISKYKEEETNTETSCHT
jgi:hypothetical protein